MPPRCCPTMDEDGPLCRPGTVDRRMSVCTTNTVVRVLSLVFMVLLVVAVVSLEVLI